MKDRRKKVFLMSVLVFFLISGVVYLFLILTAVEEIKKRSYLVSNYTLRERALLPIFKYLKMIESESVSELAKTLIPADFKKVDEFLNSGSVSDSSSPTDPNTTSSFSSKDSRVYDNYSREKPFKPSSKIESSLSGGLGATGGGNASQTFSSLSGDFSSGNVGKSISISKKTSSLSGSLSKENNLISRLNYTKTSLGSALKAKSADAARLDWERGFSGSVKPNNEMFYKDSALYLDKIKSGVADLKFQDEKGLSSPDVSAPKIESSVSPDKAKEIMENLAKDMAKSMINSLGNALEGYVFSGNDAKGSSDGVVDKEKAANLNEDVIKAEVEKWKFDPNENVVTTYFSCDIANCEKLGIDGGGFYKAYFPDGFVLTLNSSGKVLDYYYCVSPVNESAFLKNYEKYVLGKN